MITAWMAMLLVWFCMFGVWMGIFVYRPKKRPICLFNMLLATAWILICFAKVSEEQQKAKQPTPAAQSQPVEKGDSK
jgi:uncharacterized protein with PQ loop repeat